MTCPRCSLKYSVTSNKEISQKCAIECRPTCRMNILYIVATYKIPLNWLLKYEWSRVTVNYYWVIQDCVYT